MPTVISAHWSERETERDKYFDADFFSQQAKIIFVKF